MLKPGENFYRLLEGKMPEYVPVFDMMPYPGMKATAVMQGPSINNFHGPQGGKDPWGVEYIANPESGYNAMPKTWGFILDDITNWRNVIKNPDLNAVDWKAMAEADNAMLRDVMQIDRNETLILGVCSGSFFLDLMGFMGFTEGLCAIAMEPDEVNALYDYMLEYYLDLQHKIIEYYKPDAIYLIDDTASKRNSFVSMDTFKELLLPHYKVMIDDAHDHGLPVQFHDCGNCAEYMELLCENGVNAWDPVQTMNDIDGVKQKLGRKLALCGCWDWVVPETWPEVDEEAIRQQVRDTIDHYAPGGGFAMCGGCNILAAAGDDLPVKIRGWVLDEAYKYGADFYRNHPEAGS